MGKFGYGGDIARFGMSIYNGWWTATKAEKDADIYNPKIKKLIPFDEIYGDLNNLGCTMRCIQGNPYTNNFVLNSDNTAKYANYLDSVLLAKYKTTTDFCKATKQDTSEISRLAKNDTLLKMFIIYNYNMFCANPAEITTYWLNSKAKEYERLFNKPVPECKQCTDLELLLMLENAIETNKPELDYSYSSQMMDYRTGKYLALYEWRFKKPAPNWDEKECSEEESCTKIGEQNKNRIQKKFKKPITEQRLALLHIIATDPKRA